MGDPVDPVELPGRLGARLEAEEADDAVDVDEEDQVPEPRPPLFRRASPRVLGLIVRRGRAACDHAAEQLDHRPSPVTFTWPCS